jgi:hypothetical protein
MQNGVHEVTSTPHPLMPTLTRAANRRGACDEALGAHKASPYAASAGCWCTTPCRLDKSASKHAHKNVIAIMTFDPKVAMACLRHTQKLLFPCVITHIGPGLSLISWLPTLKKLPKCHWPKASIRGNHVHLSSLCPWRPKHFTKWQAQSIFLRLLKYSKAQQHKNNSYASTYMHNMFCLRSSNS